MNPQIQDQLAGINETVSKINKASGTAPKLTPLTPITPNSASEDVAIIDVPQITTPAADKAEVGFTPAQAQEANQIADLEANRQSAEQGRNDSLDAFLDDLTSQQGEQALIAQAEKQLGVEQARLDLNALNEEMLGEKNSLNKLTAAYNKQVQKIQETGGGLKIGAQAEIANATDKYNATRADSLARMADLSITQYVAQNKFESAQRLANQKASILFEAQQQRLEIRRFLYQENKDLFNQAEQREFNAKQNQLERNLENERADFQALQNAKLEAMKMAQLNGAPTDVIRAIQESTTPEEVFEKGGQYASVDMLDRQYKQLRNAMAAKEYEQLVNEINGVGETGLTDDQRMDIAKMPESKQAQTLMTLNANLTRLKSLYDQYGTWNFFDRDAKRRIQSLRSQLEIDIAVAGGQGAISEQEADRYQNIVGGSLFQSGKGASTAIDEAINVNDTKIKNNISFVQSAIPGSTIFEPFTQFLEEKNARTYVDTALGEGIPENDSDAIDMYLNTFNSNSTPSS